MTRVVRQINVAPGQSEVDVPRLFSDFADRANIVLLGDPGAGKTHLFNQAAGNEHARFIKARAFLSTPADMLRGQAVFIDGLDEKRAGRGDRDTIDALVTKLFEVAPSKVRISCRAADWLGESDLAAIAPFFDQQGGACVLYLESLSGAEQIAVLTGQGVSGDAAGLFLNDAVRRGLGDFLENPQNLIMLWRAVQTGAWPATRKELFELSTKLMLQESNVDRARSGVGVFSVAELRPVAGAVCTARLISDVAAINLTDQEGTADIPSYRSFDLFPPERVQAALGRRVFDATPETETADYAHRTTAEFLAAEFLASLVRGGLPFGRVIALIGVDGYPASELRGLHAWLAVHLPEHADQLIEADPYGVLTYGDAASLSSTSCAVLVRALVNLSRANPWFRSGNWQAQPIGALARPDMVNEFRAILNNPDSGFGIRSVVIDALALGTPLPAMLPDLEIVLARQASPYAERLHAFNALLRLGDSGKATLRTVFDTELGVSSNDLRLRDAIVQALYSEPYGPDDVIRLVEATLHLQDTVSSAMLWSLANAVPEHDLPVILDGIRPLPADDVHSVQRTWEAGSFYTRVLVRAWSTHDLIEPDRAIIWLHKRIALRGDLGGSHARDLHTAIQSTPERLKALAVHFFRDVKRDNAPWLEFHSFRKAIFFALSLSELTAIAADAFDCAEAGSDRRLFLYEMALSLSFHTTDSDEATIFNELYFIADTNAELRAARDATVVTNLPANYYEGRSGWPSQSQNDRARQRQEFDHSIEQIRSGGDLGWLQHLAFFYFGLYSDTDRTISPSNRISAWLGDERVDVAIEGLTKSLSRNDLPGFDDVMTLAEDHRHYDWWYALIAGLNERSMAGLGLTDLSDDFLKGMLVFDITNQITLPEDNTEKWVVHPWREELMVRQPELVRDAYIAIAQARLSRNEEFIDGLRELLNDSAFEPYRPGIALDLLGQFPNACPGRLGELLDAVTSLPALHQDFVRLASPIISGAPGVDERQRDLWLVVAYAVAPSQFEDSVKQRAALRPDLVFDLRDRAGFARRTQPDYTLPLPMLEFMAELTGSLFPDTPPPTGGAWGDTNGWNASEHFRTLANMLSASPSLAATDSLRRLLANPRLISYRQHLLYALDSQCQRRRESEYDRPNWPQTIAALSNSAPATVSDLHALLVTQLRDFADRTARANTDIFKQFWNLDAYSKPTQPRPEEACRDNIVTMLRPTLLPMGVIVEPEAHMVADKRADISAAMPGRKILCELKRDYHAEVWTAMMGQLERFYAHDPEAKGFGVYMVFWFGSERPRQIPMPPNGMQRPNTATEMETMLQSLLPEDKSRRLTVIVVDVSGEV